MVWLGKIQHWFLNLWPVKFWLRQRPEVKFIVLFFASVMINRFCSWFPANYYLTGPFNNSPFPFYSMQINVQSYVYFISVHFSIIWFYYAVIHLFKADHLKQLFNKFVILEWVSLLDFILIYEHPWFHLGDYGVEFTDPKLFIYAYLLLQWKISHYSNSLHKAE